MATIKKVLNKRSAVSGRVPTASIIDYGEIAINYFDGDEQIFIRNNNQSPTLVNFRTDAQNHKNFVDVSGDTMTGVLNISNGGLNVTGDTTLNNNLTVLGDTNLKVVTATTANVTNLNATGNTTASTLTVTGNTAIGGNLNVTGTVTSNSQIYSSDKRLKENIIPISDNDIMKVADIELKSFNFIKDKNKIKRYGIIAQDAEAVGLNELVKYDENGMRGIDYIEFLLLKVAQLEEEIKELKNK